MERYSVVTNRKLRSLHEEEEKTGEEFIEWIKEEECEGLLYNFYVDKRNGKGYAIRESRTVHMGFNSNEDGKIDELIEIVEREGGCKASWGVDGRTAHQLLALQLKELLPQYDFKIDYDMYLCVVEKKNHRTEGME